jgi:hypothetical protein
MAASSPPPQAVRKAAKQIETRKIKRRRDTMGDSFVEWRN